VHTIGYCVAGTKLAATLALLDARGEQDKVASATFFTAQVDFSEAGDLSLFLGDEQMEMIGQISAEKGYMDGRYMAPPSTCCAGATSSGTMSSTTT
jgi:polyhydroxyalkanoate synthase